MKYLRISQPLHSVESPLHQIGYVHSTQGLKGDIFLVLKSVDDSWLDEWSELILQPKLTQDRNGQNPSKDSPSPKQQSAQKQSDGAYFALEIESLRPHKKQGKNGYVVRLFDLDDVNDVEALVGHSVWIPKSFLEAKRGENIFLAEIEGFTVVDGLLGEIGPITGFSSNGAQDLIEVDYKGDSHYIPLVKAFIERIDKKNKKLFMNIPEGLLEG